MATKQIDKVDIKALEKSKREKKKIIDNNKTVNKNG